MKLDSNESCSMCGRPVRSVKRVEGGRLLIDVEDDEGGEWISDQGRARRYRASDGWLWRWREHRCPKPRQPGLFDELVEGAKP